MGVSMVQWCTVSMIDDVWAHAFKRNPSANERIYSGIWRVQLLFAWTAISNANNNYGCLSNIELRIKLVEIPKNKFFFSIKIVAFDRFTLSANLFILHWKHTPHRCVWGKNWVLKSLIADVAEIKSTQISSNKHLCLQSIMLFMYFFWSTAALLSPLLTQWMPGNLIMFSHTAQTEELSAIRGHTHTTHAIIHCTTIITFALPIMRRCEVLFALFIANKLKFLRWWPFSFNLSLSRPVPTPPFLSPKSVLHLAQTSHKASHHHRSKKIWIFSNDPKIGFVLFVQTYSNCDWFTEYNCFFHNGVCGVRCMCICAFVWIGAVFEISIESATNQIKK